jgi:AraC-like DNA-binding protein
LKTQKGLSECSAHEAGARQAHCFAGLTDIAIPVMVGGQHVATLLSGQIFSKEPTHRDFEKMLRSIGVQDKEWKKKAEKSYFETPVVLPEALDAVIQLLTIFAQHLSDDISRHLMAVRPETESAVVGNAKKYVEMHSHEALTLEQVLQHVHASRFHFCKTFKKTTGITFTEYVARVRVEKAKALLLDPASRVSEVVFTAGFGSIPQFNSVFKRIVGMSPTAYRNKQRGFARGGESPASKLTAAPSGDAEVPGNIIRTTAFQPGDDTPPPNIIRPALRHSSRRIARA